MISNTTKKTNVGSVMGKYDTNNVILSAKLRLFFLITKNIRNFAAKM